MSFCDSRWANMTAILAPKRKPKALTRRELTQDHQPATQYLLMSKTGVMTKFLFGGETDLRYIDSQHY